MNLGEDFVALVRPMNVYPQKASILYDKPRKQWHVQNRVDPMNVTSAYCSTEAELWGHCVATIPGLIGELRASPFVVSRGLADRAECFINYGASTVEGLEAALHRKMFAIHDAVLTSLGARRVTRAKPVLRFGKPSANISMLVQTSKVEVPFDAGQEVLMAVHAIPSPVDSSVWSMTVRLPTRTNEAIYEAQHRLSLARESLQHQGILIGDALSGTGYADYL